MARASSSVSSGQTRIEAIAHVLIEFLADGTDSFQDAAGIHEHGAGLDSQLRGNLDPRAIPQKSLLETLPVDLPEVRARTVFKRVSQDLLAMELDPFFGHLQAIRGR